MPQDNWCYHACTLSGDVSSIYFKSIWIKYNTNLHILSVSELLLDIQIEVCKYLKYEIFQKNPYFQLSLLLIHSCHLLCWSYEYHESYV